MPLKLNVGLSRKVGEPNYSSRGASVNVEQEVDSSLVTDPGKLKEHIRNLFALVRAAVAEELNNGNGHHAPAIQTTPVDGQQNAGPTSGGRSTSQPSNTRRATSNQVKAIYAITRSQNINLQQLLSERFGTNRPDELMIAEASQLIDELKKRERGET
jgi:hypothetical protein